MAYGQNHYLEIGQIQKTPVQGKEQFYIFFPSDFIQTQTTFVKWNPYKLTYQSKISPDSDSVQDNLEIFMILFLIMLIVVEF